MTLVLFGWIGTALTVLTFGIWNFKKLNKYFPHGNAIAAVFLITYEISIQAWPIVMLHSFIFTTSIIKIVKD